MQKLIRRAAHRIAAAQGADAEREAVIAYGLLGITQVAVILLLAVAAGLLTGTLPECLLIDLVVGTFRKSTGGAHASTLGGCIAVSVVTIAGMANAARYLIAPFLSPLGLFFFLLLYVPVGWVVFRRAPVDSPNKPIRTENKRARLRRQSMIYLLCCFTLSLACAVASLFVQGILLYRLSVALLLALVWQAFTLTRIAQGLFHRKAGKV